MSSLTAHEPVIVLRWLIRLRWLAVIGQLGSAVVAHWLFDIELPMLQLGVVVAITAVTNLVLEFWKKPTHVGWNTLLMILLLDVALLTAALGLSGGPDNPFWVLYAVHVAIAVLALGVARSWMVWVFCVAGFAVLTVWHRPLDITNAPSIAMPLGQWLALVLTAGLMIYFVGKIDNELRAVSRELATARDRALKGQRFAALTGLAAGAAHELGSPLGTIAIVAKELEIDSAATGASQDIIDDAKLIRQEVERCRGILMRMRMDVGDDLLHQPGPVAVDAFIDRASADLDDNQRSRLVVDRPPAVGEIYLASRSIQRAVGVLLRNAFDASKPTQRVTLKILVDDRQLDDRQVAFEVQDEGAGMAADVLKRAGEPFFTTKEMGHGMGMGLFLVKLVAEQNDGRLDMQSTAGQGTRARLTFPVPAQMPTYPAAKPEGSVS